MLGVEIFEGVIYFVRKIWGALILCKKSGGADISRDICRKYFVTKMCKKSQKCHINTFYVL